MKTVKNIISHIISRPQYKKISQKRCFDKVVKLLPPHLQNAVLFTYVKNQTLFFVLNHPGLKMEFHYKVNLIKSLLKQLKTIDKECSNMQDIKEVKAFVSNKPKQKESQKKSIKYTFKELSSGEFKIITKNKNLKNLFQKIQKAIKDSNASTN